MSEIGDRLDEIANEAGQQARKEAELVNVEFVIKEARLHNYEWEGEKRRSWIATVETSDGEDDYFIGGAKSFRQLEWLNENGLLPFRARLVRDTTKDGSPYILKEAAPGSVAQAKRQKESNIALMAQATVGLDQAIDALMSAGCADSATIDEHGNLALKTEGVPLQDQAKAMAVLKGLLNGPDPLPF